MPLGNFSVLGCHVPRPVVKLSLVRRLGSHHPASITKTSAPSRAASSASRRKIGSSLQAEVCVQADGGKYDILASLGDDLRFVLICSKTRLVRSAEEKLECRALSYAKCGRCWHVREDVGHHPEHPEICERCVSNLYGEGEARACA